MAGLGFKDFAVGEVLTSADVDGYLMQQSVMRFADSAARGSALGTAVGTGVPLAEGMVSYLDDTNSIEVYDGSAWQKPGRLLQFVVATDTTNRTTTSATFVDASISASITPLSSSSILLVRWTFTGSATSGQGEEGTESIWFRLADGDGNPIAGTNGARHFEEQNGQYSSSGDMGIVSAVIDPAGSGARTYKGQFRFDGGLTSGVQNANQTGVLTIMEISS